MNNNDALATTNGSGIMPTMSPYLNRGQMEGAMKAATEAFAQRQTAMMFPRVMVGVRAELVALCENPVFARAALYHKPVGGKDRVGLSARFAESAISALRNMDSSTIQISDQPDSQTWRVRVSDIETNITHSEEVFVPKRIERKRTAEGQVVYRSRLNSQGEMVHLVDATDDEVNVMRLALCSKTRRNLILMHVPADLRLELLQKCINISQDADAKDPGGETKRIMDSFFSIGVTVDDLKAYLGHSPKNINPTELAELRGIFAAIRDGEAHWGEYLALKAEQKPGRVQDFVRKQQGDKPAAPRKPRAATTEPKPPAQGAADDPPPAEQRATRRRQPAQAEGEGEGAADGQAGAAGAAGQNTTPATA